MAVKPTLLTVSTLIDVVLLQNGTPVARQPIVVGEDNGVDTL